MSKMISYTWDYIQKHPKETKRLLGINFEQLEQLLERGKILHQKNLDENEKKKIRIYRAGGGNHPKLSLEEQIILMLIYLRHNLSFQVLSLLFHVSESTAHNLFNYWEKLFAEDLPPSLLEQVKKLEESEEVKQELVNYELIVDSWEQPIERPNDPLTQKEYFSGKQKRHTLKNQLIVLPLRLDIVDVVLGKPGPVSDINLCRQTLSKLNSQQGLLGDKAYVGEGQITTPVKKPKNGELTTEQKENNQVISSARIGVEHWIRVVKIFAIARERFRLRISQYNSVISLVCSLVRLRVGTLILEVVKSPASEQTIDVLMSHSFPSKMELETSNP
jgi:hypothetical protein